MGGEALRERRWIDGAPRVALQDLDLDAHHPRHVAPPEGEQATLEHEHGLAPRQHVGERGLPAAMAVRGVDVGAPRRPEDLRQILEKAVRDSDHIAVVDVDGRSMHRGEHGVGNVRGTRNAEELATPGDCHGVDSTASAKSSASTVAGDGRAAAYPRYCGYSAAMRAIFAGIVSSSRSS